MHDFFFLSNGRTIQSKYLEMMESLILYRTEACELNFIHPGLNFFNNSKHFIATKSRGRSTLNSSRRKSDRSTSVTQWQ